MAYARLERLSSRVAGDLERHFEGRPARLREALGWLLRLMVTSEVPDELRRLAKGGRSKRSRIRGLRTHLKELEAHLGGHARLPECLCARYKYRLSEARARKLYRVADRDWSFVHALARRVGWSLDLQVPFINYEEYGWHDPLEESFVNVEVALDPEALDGMLVCILEAYLSPKPSRRKGYEVYGVNLGMIRENLERRRGRGVVITRHVSVMRSQPQLSADGDTGGVEPNQRSLEAILEATATLFPQYQAVGDFHSHPYDDLARLEAKRGWEYSADDEAVNIDVSRTMAELGHPPEVAFVVAIAHSAKRVRRGRYRGLDNTLQLSVGDCRVVIAAYRSLESGCYSARNICLQLPGRIGW